MQLRTRSNTFDTDTALKVFSRDNGFPPKHVDFRRETLYRTRGGALFVHIEGGTDQSIIHKGALVKEKIEPISLLEASDWLRSRNASGVARSLTDPKETNRLCLKVPQKTMQKLSAEKARTGKTYSQIIEELLLEHS